MAGERLAVMLITAGRIEYAVDTLRSTAVNLRHDGPVHWHIADDSDDDAYVARLHDLIATLRPEDAVTVSRVRARAYGANYNAATQVVHAYGDYVLVLEDDWRLLRPLDTAPILKMLTCEGHQDKGEWSWAVPPPPEFRAQSVRLGYLGYQWEMDAHLFKTDEYLWMGLCPDSKEQCVAAGHPRIETVAYQRHVGPWNETTNPGMTELDWVQRPAARQGVVWPLTLVSLSNSVTGDMYAHIGTVRSY